MGKSGGPEGLARGRSEQYGGEPVNYDVLRPVVVGALSAVVRLVFACCLEDEL